MSEDSLGEKLQSFAQQITTADDTREGVSVVVRRDNGFENLATTPTGLTICLDEPTNMGGRAQAPDPAEYLLAAIGASLSVTLTVHAALRQIQVDDVEIALSAAIDGVPFFQPGAGEQAGLLDITADLHIRSPESRVSVETLVRDALRAAPVVQTLNQQLNLSLTIQESS